MSKEITNGMKADLEKVLCDFYICDKRGEYPRCYLDIYNLCWRYKLHEVYKKATETKLQERK